MSEWLNLVLGKNVIENKHTKTYVSSVNRLINNCKVCVCEGKGTLRILFKYGFIFSKKTLVFMKILELEGRLQLLMGGTSIIPSQQSLPPK